VKGKSTSFKGGIFGDCWQKCCLKQLDELRLETMGNFGEFVGKIVGKSPEKSKEFFQFKFKFLVKFQRLFFPFTSQFFLFIPLIHLPSQTLPLHLKFSPQASTFSYIKRTSPNVSLRSREKSFKPCGMKISKMNRIIWLIIALAVAASAIPLPSRTSFNLYKGKNCFS
jgi:hypothetical protein